MDSHTLSLHGAESAEEAEGAEAAAGAATQSHLLRFTSLHDQGRGICVPCDASGEVDMDSLTERLRNSYLGARAMVGREYAYPTIQLAPWIWGPGRLDVARG